MKNERPALGSPGPSGFHGRQRPWRSISELSSYDDWGIQQFESTGWSAPANFTGEQTDPTQGLNHYYARTYDPGTGSWTSADPWRGLRTEPQSLHRYAYVETSPATLTDGLGFKAKQQRISVPPNLLLPECVPYLSGCTPKTSPTPPVANRMS
ncbi:RHS repeat-associated core domain-containing protein [Leifsonia sp. 2MCAF36]|uniref:RHS repeat-associated core domain-containing protein n=1 Tax=Leifsonia sp. 2MCAF36 TaxID=3232988 RepID=UPI003F9D4DE1